MARAVDYRSEDDDDARADHIAVEDDYIIRRILAHLRRGINSEEGDVTDARQTLLNTYLGMEYGNERDGYSRVVTREGLQAIEWALPALMRVFLGGVKVVEFRPSGPQDVDQARHETDVVNHHFFDGNPNASGFLTLYCFLKDLFMYPNAYMKIEADEEEEENTQNFNNVLPGELEILYKSKDVDVEVRSSEVVDGEELFSIVTRKQETTRRIVVASVAPNNCIIAHDHRHLSVDRSRFVCERELMSYSDLLKSGYSADELDGIEGGDEDSSLWNDEDTNLLFYVDEQPIGGDEDDSTEMDADKMYWVHTCHMDIDCDGDDIAERRKIVLAGRKIISNEPTEYQPFVSGSAMPMPHKHIGMGMLEIVTDLQKIMTALTRNLLDNIYAQNVQRVWISESAMLSDNSTMDAFLDRQTEMMPVRGRPAEAVMPEIVTPIVDSIVKAIEVFRDVPQLRTGVAPNLSLDPSVLEKSTMGAFVGALEQASQRLELIARLVAETVLVPAFQKVHYLLREHFDQPQQIEINGQWVTVDPSSWSKRSSMKVNVGLGFNNKQMMLMLLQQLLMIQKEALPLGLADAAKIYATLEKLVEQANLGHAGTFFNDPRAPGFQPPPPPEDPAMVAAKAQAKALADESRRKDAELELTKAEKMEAAEAKASELLTNALKAMGAPTKTQAEIAKILAEITALNRSDKHQAGPAEDSSQDEMQAAGELAGEPGSHYGPPKATTATPDKLDAKPNGKTPPK